MNIVPPQKVFRWRNGKPSNDDLSIPKAEVQNVRLVTPDFVMGLANHPVPQTRTNLVLLDKF